MMTKAERSELRSLIRQRFKVLRADVDQRHAELLAELEVRLTDKFATDDAAWTSVAFVIGEAAREANRKANDAVRALVGPDGWPSDRDKVLIQEAALSRIRATAAEYRKETDKPEMRKASRARIDATVKAAHLQLDRQEVDLLERLAVGALESDEARGFLAEIPTVSSLVPAERLLELERSLRGES
jgi:hypothetical protein